MLAEDLLCELQCMRTQLGQTASWCHVSLTVVFNGINEAADKHHAQQGM